MGRIFMGEVCQKFTPIIDFFSTFRFTCGKVLIAIRDVMEERIGWEINKGEISLLLDQWLPFGVIGYELRD